MAQPSTAPSTSLPTLGDSVSDDMDLRTERRLGEQIMREVRRDPDYLDDPVLLAYVGSLWQPLVQAARQRGDLSADLQQSLAFEAFLVRDRGVNAFALPGGFMGVYLGLMASTATRDELAAVLAHELAHITQRHIARSLSNQSRASLVGAAALLATLLAASRSNNVNPNAVQAAVVGGQALMAQTQLNFSRDMEREADRVGYGIFRGADYAPGGVAAMFEKLESANRLNDSGNFPYLRSHPLTVERIGDAKARVDAERDTAKTPKLGHEHEWMRARARVLMDPRVESLRRVQQAPSALSRTSTPDLERATTQYAAALAALALNEPKKALDALRASEASLVGNVDSGQARALVRQARAEAMAADGQGLAALKLLDEQADTSRSALLLRASIAADVARAGAGPASAADARAALHTSTEALQGWVAEHRQDALAWSQLSRLSDQQGHRLRALRAEAESAYAKGDVRGGIDRLRSAQRLTREGAAGTQDRIEQAIVDSRAREMSAVYMQLNPKARISP
jgi:beta-barrel assembly-enhancing protease